MITTHILDTALGKPADAVQVSLSVKIFKEGQVEWVSLASCLSDADGRVLSFFKDKKHDWVSGEYRLNFALNAYFKRSKRECFFPQIDISFMVKDISEHFHVPLLISPFTYSTYRGS